MKLQKKAPWMAMLCAGVLFSACETEQDTSGRISLSLTDAPIDTENVTGVYITFSEVSYKRAGAWYTLERYEEPMTVNLLDLTNGESLLLGDFEIEAGEYSEIRFAIEQDGNGGVGKNDGTYLEFADGSTQVLEVPSGASSGYKGKGNFVVPVNGSVDVTADFDVRKSVVQTGSGKYLLKPVIRLVVNNQAGSITGTIENPEEGKTYVVYAYEDGTYTEEEATAPAPEEAAFANAVTSDKVEEGAYVLPYLAAGTYDLVVVAHSDSTEPQVLQIIEDVTVKSQESIEQNITLE